MAIIYERIRQIKRKMKENKKRTRRIYLNNIDMPYRETYLKLFEEKSIKKCEEIINKEIKDNCRENFLAINYFCYTHMVLMWNGKNHTEDNDRKALNWQDEFGKICIKNLYKLLEKYNKEHLKIIGSCDGYFWVYDIAEIEI